jgi:hypothetical protein
VTTKRFLEVFGFASLRDLPDLERLKAERLLQSGQGEDDLDSVLGLAEEEQDTLEDNDGRCHVWMSPADQKLFRRCADRGCGHVFGLSRGQLDPLALMLSADPLPPSRERA